MATDLAQDSKQSSTNTYYYKDTRSYYAGSISSGTGYSSYTDYYNTDYNYRARWNSDGYSSSSAYYAPYPVGYTMYAVLRFKCSGCGALKYQFENGTSSGVFEIHYHYLVDTYTRYKSYTKYKYYYGYYYYYTGPFTGTIYFYTRTYIKV